VRADAERNEEARAASRERLHRRHVEVIVVVVRHEHGVDRRQVGEGDRRRMEALRPCRERRRVLGEDRVEQHAHAVDLDIDAGVADPERAQPVGRRRFGERGLVDREHRQRRRRNAHLVARELADGVLAQVGERCRRLGNDVDEAAVAVVRIRLRAREPRAVHAGAERRQREDDPAGDREGASDERERDDAANEPARPPRARRHRKRRRHVESCGTDIAQPCAGVVATTAHAATGR
jgi:hypothetical protein